MLTTRCPACGTVFRVRSEQLTRRGGRVRCGKCRVAFSALATLEELPEEDLSASASAPQPAVQTPNSQPSVAKQIVSDSHSTPNENAASAVSQTPVATQAEDQNKKPPLAPLQWSVQITPQTNLPRYSKSGALGSVETDFVSSAIDFQSFTFEEQPVARTELPALPPIPKPTQTKAEPVPEEAPLAPTPSQPPKLFTVVSKSELQDQLTPAARRRKALQQKLEPQTFSTKLFNDIDKEKDPAAQDELANLLTAKEERRKKQKKTAAKLHQIAEGEEPKAKPAVKKPQKPTPPAAQSFKERDIKEIEGAQTAESTIFLHDEILMPAPEKKKRRTKSLLWFIGALILASALLAQLTYTFRANIARDYPALRPYLEQMCQKLQCALPYPRNIALISIVGDLSRENSNANVYNMEVTLRNTADFAQEWPTIELTLKDALQRVLAQRPFTAKEWLASSGISAPAFAARDEITIRIPLKIDQPVDAYNVRVLYPE